MSIRLLVGYGSHTGQAESIAKQIGERAERRGVRVTVDTLNQLETQLSPSSFLVVVISSTGDGDPPENASRFIRRLSRKDAPPDQLAGVHYALLGLGDSNFSTYQGVPIKVDKILASLGATREMERGEADDQVGLELVVEPWIDRLFAECLAKRFELTPEGEEQTVEGKVEEMEAEMEEQLKIEQKTEGKVESLVILPYDYPPDASVKKGNASLSGEANLRVPLAPLAYLKGALTGRLFTPPTDLQWQNGTAIPGVISTIPINARVVSHSLLTSFDAKKPKRELVFELVDRELDYQPGDAFYIVPRNDDNEVQFLISRLGLGARADMEYRMFVDPETKKEGATVPPFIPPISSIRHLLTFCLDIRRAPGRPLLRVLADSATDEKERRRLLELCSAQGVAEFTSFIRQAALSLVDILIAFPSVKPKIDRLIENLPRLMPRPYSFSSCREQAERRLRFAYSIREEEAVNGRRYERVGVQTKRLMELQIGDEVQLLEKEAARFRLPPLGSSLDIALYTPLVLIGPGTGISTFLSFIRLIAHHVRQGNSEKEKILSTPRLVFFGCRNREKDYIYREELEGFEREGMIRRVYLAESGVEGRPKYVQDCLRECASEVMTLLRSTESSQYPARVYVCGDAAGMSKDLLESFVNLAAQEYGMALPEARKHIMELKKTDRYIEDVWS